MLQWEEQLVKLEKMMVPEVMSYDAELWLRKVNIRSTFITSFIAYLFLAGM